MSGESGRRPHRCALAIQVAPCKLLKLVAQHRNAAEFDDLAVKQRHVLGSRAVLRTVPSIVGHEQGASGQHDKYRSALAAHPG